MSETEAVANALHWIARLTVKHCQDEDALTAEYHRLGKILAKELEEAYGEQKKIQSRA